MPPPRSSARAASRRSPASVYSKPLTKGEIAAFAIETARACRRGDEVARDLYERGAAELGVQIAAVIHQTGLDGGPFPVGLIGSAYKAGAVFVEPLARAIHEDAPRGRGAAGGDGAGRRQPAAGGPRVRAPGRARQRKSSRGLLDVGAQPLSEPRTRRACAAPRRLPCHRSRQAPPPRMRTAAAAFANAAAASPARPSASAMKNAAANTSPAPRSSSGPSSRDTGSSR